MNQARDDALDFLWVDTFCIDKRSSAELQEAISSMYRYYSEAALCYVYLRDVQLSQGDEFRKMFMNSEWFESRCYEAS